MREAQPRKDPLRSATLQLAILDRRNQAMRTTRFARKHRESFDHPLHQPDIQAYCAIARPNENAYEAIRPSMIVHVNRDRANARDASSCFIFKHTRNFKRTAPGFVRVRQCAFLQPECDQLAAQHFCDVAEYPLDIECLGRACWVVRVDHESKVAACNACCPSQSVACDLLRFRRFSHPYGNDSIIVNSNH